MTKSIIKVNLKVLSTICFVLGFNSFSYTQNSEFGLSAFMFKQEGKLIRTFDPGTTTGNINYTEDVNENDGVPGMSYRYYHPFYKITESFTLGGQTGLDLYAYYSKKDDVQNQFGQTVASGSSSGLYLGYELPLYLNLRLLNGSAEDNTEGFGLGVGVGYVAHGFTILDEKGFLLSPTLMAELKYNNFGLRFEVQNKKYHSFYKSNTGDIPRLTTSFYSIGITMAFGE